MLLVQNSGLVIMILTMPAGYPPVVRMYMYGIYSYIYIRTCIARCVTNAVQFIYLTDQSGDGRTHLNAKYGY